MDISNKRMDLIKIIMTRYFSEKDNFNNVKSTIPTDDRINSAMNAKLKYSGIEVDVNLNKPLELPNDK
jgi:hypothetical protein